MILPVNSLWLRRRIRWSCILFLLVASIQWAGATAKGETLDARVTSVNGPALRRNNQRAFILSRGDLLNPGDEIDTRGGGRVVIELADGSVVVVHPNSRIVLCDYRSAASLREMFRILIGRVRVKVAHYGDKPNPYRVNSPTASILVRGTEFDVAVEPSGDTILEVYEGLVEVQSLGDPLRRALLSAGRGALVKPNEIRIFTPGSKNRSDKRGAKNDDAANANNDNNGQASAKRGDADAGLEAAVMYPSRRTDDGLIERERETSGESTATAERRNETDYDDIQRSVVVANTATNARVYLANDYERYVESLAGLGWSLPLRRFAAFADSHFDSLDNPAYSTDIAAMEGRVWLIPFVNEARGADMQSGSAGYPFSGNLIRPFDSGLLGQGDFFIPLDRSRMVIGGAVAIGADQSQSLTVDLTPASLISLFPEGSRISRYDAVATETTSITDSLIAARRFGNEGRTSVGAGVELVSSDGYMRGQTSLANSAGALQTEDLKTESQINRLRFRVGMTREFDGGHKLGLLYRHESASAAAGDRSRQFNDMPLDLDSMRQEGRSSEVSFILRGPLTRRLFYGLEGSLLWGRSDGQIRRAVISDSTTRADAGSAGVSFGLGFALRRTTVLSADLGFGLSRHQEARRENATGNPVEDRQERERLATVRLGLQTDVWRRSFISLSAMAIGQTNTIDLSLYPDLFGRRLNSLGLVEPDGRSRRNSTYLFSDFGGGWRFNTNLMAEYICSINGDLGPPRHIFLLRYIFKRESRKEILDQ